MPNPVNAGGRPRHTPRGARPVTVTLSRETLDEVDTLAMHRGLTRSAMINHLAAMALKAIQRRAR